MTATKLKWPARWTPDGLLLESKLCKGPGRPYKVSRPVSREARYYAQRRTPAGWREVEKDTRGLPRTYRTEKAAQAACENYCQ